MEGTWGILDVFNFCCQIFRGKFHYNKRIKWLKPRKKHISKFCAYMQIAGNLKEEMIFLYMLNHLKFAIMNLWLAKMSFRYPSPHCNIQHPSFSKICMWSSVTSVGDDVMDFSLLLVNKQFRSWRFWNLLGLKLHSSWIDFEVFEINRSLSAELCISICPWKLPSHQWGIKFLYSLYNR